MSDTKQATPVTMSQEEEAILAGMPEEKATLLRKLLASRAKSRRIDAEKLEAKHPHLIEGSVGFDAEAKKQFGVIRCMQEGCSNERRVFTSDLWQVTVCVEHRDAARKAKREEAQIALAAFRAEQKARKEQVQG